MKTTKEKFAEAFDLFNSLSGFAWNPTTRRFEVEDEVWEDFIKDKPQATKWRTMQIRHYDLLKGLFGADRAGGKKPNGTNHEDVQNSAPNVELFSPASAPSNQSTRTPGSRGTKRKAPMVDLIESQVEKMSVEIGLVAEALNSSTAISDKLHNVAERQVMVVERQVAAIERRNDIYHEQLTVLRQSRSRVYTEAEVWDLLCELNVLDPYRMQCYEYLCSNEQKKRLIFGNSKMVRTSKSKRGKANNSITKSNQPSRAHSKKSKNTNYESQLVGCLDYTRFFTNQQQMDMFITGFSGRNLVEPRFMNIELFRTNGFQFQELLEYQGLKDFVSIKCEYLLELVKVFYCNLTISNGDLCSEVKRVKIRVKPGDWLTIVGLKFQGEKLEVGNIRAWERYDRDEAVKAMIRVGLQQPSKVNTGSLKVEDRLLHYTLARILIPRGSNYAQLTEEDIFVLWVIKERILINWPYYICQHMQKVKARKTTDLPYAMLITKLLEHYGVDTAKEGEVSMCWSHNFEWAKLNKMKIKQIDGVWQYAYEGVIEQRDHAEVAHESPNAGTTNVTHVQSVDDNMHRILTAIEALHDTMIEHHGKVEKKIEEMVNRIQSNEDRLPPPTLG
ncbi:hypothetical protein SESBI_28172 [Sesbania bispinosa]|nr:hypothetical protein SESBI_28172 [Sesbania bispinosa]